MGIQQSPQMIIDQLGLGNLHQHADQAILNQLKAGNCSIKYLSLKRKGSGSLIARNSRPNGTAGNAVAGKIETFENGFKTFGTRQHVIRINAAVLQFDQSSR